MSGVRRLIVADITSRKPKGPALKAALAEMNSKNPPKATPKKKKV